MYNPENMNRSVDPAEEDVKKPKKKKESIRFAIKSKEIRDEREEKIDELVKDILVFLTKNKIDDRDAKVALYRTGKIIAARCKITK